MEKMNCLYEQTHLTIRRPIENDTLSGFHAYWSTSPILSAKLADIQNFDCNVDLIQSKEGNIHIALTSKSRAIIAHSELKMNDEDVVDLLDSLCTNGHCLIPNPWHTA